MENTTNVTLATPDSRTTVTTDSNVTLEDLLTQNNVNFSRASVMLDGTTLTQEQLRNPLSALNAGEACTICVSVKLQNA